MNLSPAARETSRIGRPKTDRSENWTSSRPVRAAACSVRTWTCNSSAHESHSRGSRHHHGITARIRKAILGMCGRGSCAVFKADGGQSRSPGSPSSRIIGERLVVEIGRVEAKTRRTGHCFRLDFRRASFRGEEPAISARNGAPARTRTWDPRLRRTVRYPTELRAWITRGRIVTTNCCCRVSCGQYPLPTSIWPFGRLTTLGVYSDAARRARGGSIRRGRR